MASIEVLRAFAGKSQSEIFEAGLAVLPKMSCEILKSRPIAYLIVSKYKEGSRISDMNLMVRFGMPPQVSLNLAGDAFTEKELADIAERIFTALEAHLI